MVRKSIPGKSISWAALIALSTGALATGAFATGAPALAQELVVGVTGAMTGPAAGSTAPAVEGLRIYIDKLNAAGGAKGRKIRLVIQDDQAQPSRAAATTKQLVQDNVHLVVNSSLSSTYAPMLQETRRAGIPVLYSAAVCPREVFPPTPDPLQFCSTAFASEYDSRAAMNWIKDEAKGGAKIGYAAMAIPISRGEIDYAESLAKDMGLTPVGKQVIPPPTPDYTPFATSLRDAQPDWVYSWAPWVAQVKTLEALRRLGWQGKFLAYSHQEAEGELKRLQDKDFYVFGGNALFQDDLPVHREIIETAKKANVSYPVDQMAEGWIGGMVLGAIAAAIDGAPDAKKVAAAMQTLKVDLQGLRGGPIEWTAQNHFRTRQYYRVYGYDAAGAKIIQVKDWMPYDVK